MRHLALGIVGSAVATLSGGCAVEPPRDAPAPVASAEQPILGGTVDNVNHATVALAPSNSQAICSGTIIAKNGGTGYVLTAAHCIKGDPHSSGFPNNPPPPIAVVLQANDYSNCFQGGTPALCDAVYQVVSAKVHPGFPTAQIPMNQSIVNDFAILTFTGATAATPVVPAVGNDGLVVGQNLELSGYGLTSYPNGFTTQRRHVTTPVNQLYGLQIEFDQTSGKGSCNGDSGGPAYELVGGQQSVVGVTSFGDQGCAQIGVYGRVQAVYNGFIAPTIGAPPVPETCDSCTLSATNAGGGCYAEVQACLSDTACDALATCLGNCAPNDNTCVQGCASANAAGVAKYNAIFDCTNCNVCSGTCPQNQCGTTTTSSTASTSTSASTGTGGAGGAGGSSAHGSGGAGGSGGGAGGGSGPSSSTSCACAVASDDEGAPSAALAAAGSLALALSRRRRRRAA